MRSTTSEQARAWAASGCMHLTGPSDGPPLVAPDGLVAATCRLGDAVGVDGLRVLGERAALLGFARHGTQSCGGATRLLPTVDGVWVAVSLARADDLALLPAWLERDLPVQAEPTETCWSAVEEVVAARRAAEVVERARLLGLPVSALAQTTLRHAAATTAVTRHRLGDAGALRRAPLVVDLSALWAGPLTTLLLANHGARVVKVESGSRPDGARRGPPAFFDLLNAGKQAVALDLSEPAGVERLRQLINLADVVVEASRPRALEQLGIDARAMVETGPRVWVSITGYGRDAPMRDWVAFGDDAAVAGGLVASREDRGDRPCFVADAVADPLTGMVAAAAALDALSSGGRWLLDVALAEVAAFINQAGAHQRWRPAGADVLATASPPLISAPLGRGPALGEHTASVLAELVR